MEGGENKKATKSNHSETSQQPKRQRTKVTRLPEKQKSAGNLQNNNKTRKKSAQLKGKKRKKKKKKTTTTQNNVKTHSKQETQIAKRKKANKTTTARTDKKKRRLSCPHPVVDFPRKRLLRLAKRWLLAGP